jgi:hypothetical protein
VNSVFQRDDWRTLKVSPLALKIPRPDQDDRNKIKADIRANGYDKRLPMVLWNDEILEGATRHSLCLELDSESALCEGPWFVNWEPRDDHDTPWAYVLRANVNKRHLTKSQIAAILVDGPEYGEAVAGGLDGKREGGKRGGKIGGRGNKKDEEPGSSSFSQPARAPQSTDQLGKEYNVSGKLIREAAQIKEHDEKHGTDGLQQLKEGRVGSVKAAKKMLGIGGKGGKKKPKEMTPGQVAAARTNALVAEARRKHEEAPPEVREVTPEMVEEALLNGCREKGRSLQETHRVEHLFVIIKAAVEAIPADERRRFVDRLNKEAF